ncbi:MIT1/WOR1 family protein [Abortiporus biennis]
MSNDSHSGSGTSQNNQAASWTEPPWSGWIETTGDALLILEAARRGIIPRVTRRLVDSERKMITSGSVFVFDEDESGIKRWTDGFFWSPSRILGNFLLYRETEKRGAGHRSARAEHDVSDEAEVNKQDGQSLSRPKTESSRMGIDRQRERSLVGSLTNSYKFKPGGMMKKTFSLTIGGVAQHLISYYKIEDVELGRLRPPSSLPELASLDISPEYLDKTHFRNPPKVEIGVDGVPRYRGEADDIDNSPQLMTAPLSLPYEESTTKRNKRYDPYGTTATTPKRTRKSKNTTATSSQESSQHDSGSASQALVHPASSYPDASLSATTTSHYGHASYGYYPMGAPGYHLPPPPPPVYSPAPYTSTLPPTSSPPPQESGTPEASPTHSQPPLSYPSYPSEQTSQSSQSSLYPYYPPHPSYSPYPPPAVHWSYSQISDNSIVGGPRGHGGRTNSA